jgi:hypothetical protein
MSRYTPWRCLGGEEEKLLIILNLGTRWGWVVSVRPRPRFTPGEITPVPIVQEAGWAPWTQSLQEKFSASVGDRTPVRQIEYIFQRLMVDLATGNFLLQLRSFHWALTTSHRVHILCKVVHRMNVTWQHLRKVILRSKVNSS